MMKIGHYLHNFLRQKNIGPEQEHESQSPDRCVPLHNEYTQKYGWIHPFPL